MIDGKKKASSGHTVSTACASSGTFYMRSIEFPYAMHRGTPLPLVPLHLRRGNEWVERWAYVDSGATYSSH